MNNDATGADPIAIDNVRASRAGLAFQEAWAPRTALEHLPASTDLSAITLEGFEEQDEQCLGIGAVRCVSRARRGWWSAVKCMKSQ